MSISTDIQELKRLFEQGPMPRSKEEEMDGLMGKSTSPLPDDAPVFKAATSKEVASRPKPQGAYKIVEYPTGRIVHVGKSVLEYLKLSNLVSWTDNIDVDVIGHWQFDADDWGKINRYIDDVGISFGDAAVTEAKPIFKAATPDQLAQRPKNIEDQIENLIPNITDAISSDDTNGSYDLYRFYTNSTVETKQVINRIFITLCGWSLETLIERTLGTEGH